MSTEKALSVFFSSGIQLIRDSLHTSFKHVILSYRYMEMI